MMKFFRRYNKHLLAVFMALLLMVWLLEDTINSLTRGAGAPPLEWGQVYGQTISEKAIDGIRRETETMAALGLDWNQFWQRMTGPVREPLELPEWYMLDAEARRRGIYVPQEEVAGLRDSIPEVVLERVRNERKASLEDIDQAIQSFLRVQRAFLTDLASLKVSEADLQTYVRDTKEKAKVKMVAMDASLFVDANYQPTDEQLRQQFEKYKDKDPNTGEDRFGYRLPEEVQIEYIEVKVDELARQQKIDEEEAHQHWKQNTDKFRPTTTQPTTSPAPAYKTYTEAREAVRKELATQAAKTAALTIGREIAKTLSTPWANQPTSQPATQPGNFRKPPAEAMDLELYPKTVMAFHARANNALVFERTQFLDRQKLSARGAISYASVLQGTEDMMTVGEAAFLVPGLEATQSDRAQQARWFHNMYETPSEPFVDYSGNVYIFRTLAARPKRAPESWEAVKEDLRRDLRLQKAGEEARQQATELADRARQVGLDQAVSEKPVLAQKLALPGQAAVKTPQPFARKDMRYGRTMPMRLQEVGFDPANAFVETVFSLAGKTTTQPSKVTLYPIESQRRWIVAQLVDILPATNQEYENERKMAEMVLLSQRRMEFAASWLNPKSIRARTEWKSANPEEDEKRLAERAERMG